MTDLILAIAHHLSVFTLAGLLVAEVVLLDSRFATQPSVVAEGRRRSVGDNDTVSVRAQRVSGDEGQLGHIPVEYRSRRQPRLLPLPRRHAQNEGRATRHLAGLRAVSHDPVGSVSRLSRHTATARTRCALCTVCCRTRLRFLRDSRCEASPVVRGYRWC